MTDGSGENKSVLMIEGVLEESGQQPAAAPLPLAPGSSPPAPGSPSGTPATQPTNPEAAPAAPPGLPTRPPKPAFSEGFEATRIGEPLVVQERKKRRRGRAQRKAYVVVHRQGEAPARVNMERSVLCFGRNPAECDIVLEGTKVSRRHTIIERDERGYYTLKDCKSRNGTLVDGQPITSMNLVDGDSFEVGEHHIEFHLE